MLHRQGSITPQLVIVSDHRASRQKHAHYYKFTGGRTPSLHKGALLDCSPTANLEKKKKVVLHFNRALAPTESVGEFLAGRLG